MKIIIAPTYQQAEQYRREQSIPKAAVAIVYDAATAYAAIRGRLTNERDVIDLGRPSRRHDAEVIEVELRIALAR